METPKVPDTARSEMSLIGESVVIKGELSCSEDLYIGGQVEGAIELKGNRLTVGPNGRVKGNVNARAAVVQGKLEGNIHASDRVDLKQSATSRLSASPLMKARTSREVSTSRKRHPRRKYWV
jgi:cytoskeletal protein CcmA (bactofilin family)